MGVDGNGRAAIEWGVTRHARDFIVNGKGEIVYKHIGPISPQTLEGKIIPLVLAARAD